MDIQQRHRDEAANLVKTWWTGYETCDLLAGRIAEALARAENAAAWKGYDFGAKEMYEACEAEYGPSPEVERD